MEFDPGRSPESASFTLAPPSSSSRTLLVDLRFHLALGAVPVFFALSIFFVAFLILNVALHILIRILPESVQYEEQTTRKIFTRSPPPFTLLDRHDGCRCRYAAPGFYSLTVEVKDQNSKSVTVQTKLKNGGPE
jgi:hypothetical protein